MSIQVTSLLFISILKAAVSASGQQENTCESGKQSWAAAAADSDKLESLHLLQFSGSRVAKRDCPLPDLQRFEPVGKGCHQDYGCLHGNHGYKNISKAWEICGHTQYCGAVLKSTDGKFYLRRANDPNEKVRGMKLYKYNCMVELKDKEMDEATPDEYSKDSEAKQVDNWQDVEERIEEERKKVKEHSLLPPRKEFEGQEKELSEENKEYAQIADEQSAAREQWLVNKAEYVEYSDDELVSEVEDQKPAEKNVKSKEDDELKKMEDKIEEESAIVRQHALLPAEQEMLQAEKKEAEEIKQEAKANRRLAETDKKQAELDFKEQGENAREELDAANKEFAEADKALKEADNRLVEIWDKELAQYGGEDKALDNMLADEGEDSPEDSQSEDAEYP